MTGTARTYRTGFEKVFDCPAGRHILAQLRTTTPSRAAGRAGHAQTTADDTGPSPSSNPNRK